MWIWVLRVKDQSVAIHTVFIVCWFFLSAYHLVEFDVRELSFRHFWLQDQHATLLRFVCLLLLFSWQHLTELYCSNYVIFWFFRLQYQVISINLSFLLHNRVNVFFLHFLEIRHSHIRIYLLIFWCVLTHLSNLPLPLLVFLKLLNLLRMLFILFIRHSTCNQDILSKFCPDCIQVAIVKLPMFWEQVFIRQVGWLHITLLFHKGNSDILINLTVRRIVDAIVHIFLLVEIVNSVILLRHLRNFRNSLVWPGLNQVKQSIIEARSPL